MQSVAFRTRLRDSSLNLPTLRLSQFLGFTPSTAARFQSENLLLTYPGAKQPIRNMLPRTSLFFTPQDLHKGLGINSGFDYDSRSLCGLLGQRGEGDTHYSKTLDSSLTLIFVARDLCDSARGHPARPNGGEMSFCIFSGLVCKTRFFRFPYFS